MIAWNFQRIVGTCQFRVPWFGYPCGYSSLTVQLAEQTKISLSYLSKIEAAGCDKSLSISVLNQIANVLSVEINEFFKEV